MSNLSKLQLWWMGTCIILLKLYVKSRRANRFATSSLRFLINVRNRKVEKNIKYTYLDMPFSSLST